METILSDSYCRLCADLKPVSVLTNMEINTEICREVTNKMTRLDLHVNFNTKLPKTVCSECMNSLERAYDFVKSVELAQEAFEDYDSSVFVDTRDEVSDDDSMDKSINEDSSFIAEESISDESEVSQELLVEYVPKNKAKEKNSKSKPQKRAVESNSTTLSKPTTSEPRNTPKISANVDLDTWQDCNWLCAVCDKCFSSPSELRVHSMQLHYMCNAYRCFDCRERILHMNTFVNHVTRHRPVLTLLCYKCSQKFDTVTELKAHKATHLDTKHICRGCNTTFPNKEELDVHMSRFYKNKETNEFEVTENTSLACVICEKTFKHKTKLIQHLLIHTDRKRTHVCETCGNSFYHKIDLIHHQIMHDEERPYKCEICQYAFKKESTLKKHAIKVHSRTKKIVCKDCGKHFQLVKDLVAHSAVHSDMKPFKCTFCDADFQYKYLLQRHVRIHSGMKPYSCTHCPLKFSTRPTFNYHTKTIHGVDNSKRIRSAKDQSASDTDTNEVIYSDQGKQILAVAARGRPRKKL